MAYNVAVDVGGTFTDVLVFDEQTGELTEGTAGSNGGGPRSAGGPLPEAEAAAIVRTLRAHAGHRGKTAAALGIDKTTLWRKMRKYRITYS